MSVAGNPGSNGSTPSMRAIWARESDSVSASMFARRCATLRPPTIGNTYGVFCSRYAIATAVDTRRNGPRGQRVTSMADARRAPRTGLDALRAELVRDGLERRAHRALVRRALPLPAEDSTPLLAGLAPVRFLRVRAQLAAREDVPRGKCQACV